MQFSGDTYLQILDPICNISMRLLCDSISSRPTVAISSELIPSLLMLISGILSDVRFAPFPELLRRPSPSLLFLSLWN